ncbi:MAG: MFS transporter [Bacillota bacterium]
MKREQKLILSKVMSAHALIHGYMLLIPLIIPIWMEELKVAEATIGLVVTAGYSVFGIANLPSGYLVDKIGAYRILQFCLGGCAVALWIGSSVQGIVGLSVALILLGAAAGLYHPAGLTLLSKKIPERGTALGLHGVGGNIGVSLLPLLAGVLLLFIDWRMLFIIYSLPAALIAVAMKLGVIEESDNSKSSDSSTATREVVDYSKLLHHVFIFILLSFLFGGLYYRGSLTFLPKYLETFALPDLIIFGEALPPARYLYSAVLIAGLIGQVAGGIISDKFSSEKVLVVVYSLTTVILLGITLSSGVVQIGLLIIFGALLFGRQPLQNDLVAEHTAIKERGLSYGLTFLSSFGCGALGAALAGFIIQNFSYQFFFILLSGFALLATGITAKLVQLIHQQAVDR